MISSSGKLLIVIAVGLRVLIYPYSASGTLPVIVNILASPHSYFRLNVKNIRRLTFLIYYVFSTFLIIKKKLYILILNVYVII